MHRCGLRWLWKPALGLWLIAASRGTQPDFSFFESKIRPVLVEHCYDCHSVSSGKIKGGLKLDTRESLLKGGDSGPAIVPGNPEESLLIRAIRYADEKLQMPPKDKKLRPEIVADFEKWVAMGAPDPRTNTLSSAQQIRISEARQHWPFRPVEAVAPPAVQNGDWARNDIDAFILAKLEEKNLKPSPEADKRTLIRRATFDLTGLPPTINEVRAFLSDNSPEAFARVVDRLLASPAYGERWARHWLDVVRYTDSFDSRGVGGEGDIAEAYRYRDWVVNAFNNDLPYDQFIRDQIAGDLLPGADGQFNTNGLIATGMYVIGEWGTGDADKEKMLTDIVDDQIDVTGRAFLGLTLACARCHDHKFDPILNEDYYGLAGIFFSSHILPNPGQKTAGSPVLRIPLASPAQITRKKNLEEQIAELSKQMQAATDEAISNAATKSLPQTAAVLETLWVWKHSEPSSRPSLHALAERENVPEAVLFAWRNLAGWNEQMLLSKLQRDVNGIKGVDSFSLPSGANTPSVTINGAQDAVGITTLILPPRSISVHPSPKAGVIVGWESPVTGSISLRGSVADSDDKCGDGIDWIVLQRSATGTHEIVRGAIENGKRADIPAQSGVHVSKGDVLEFVIGPKGGYECDTTTLNVEIASGDLKWNLADDVLAAERSNPVPDRFGHAAVWHFQDGAIGGNDLVNPLLAKWIAAGESEGRVKIAEEIERSLADVVKGNTNSTAAPLWARLHNPRDPAWALARGDLSLISNDAAEELRKLRHDQDSLRAQLPPPFPVAHGFQEGGTPESAYAGFHDSHILIRGRYDRPGEIVPRRFPRVLAGDEAPTLPPNSSGRLQLANWIASPANPLTARVMVNRIWQHHFGEGIVRTPNNFGKLGTPPTHPELLDYLAGQFVKSGWSVKAMHRLIMLSAAYRQSSIPDAATLESDPDNLLFGRMNRRRLESEPIRDSLLSAAGNLNLAQGGKAIRDLNTDRRTLYVMTIRSDRATYQTLFDAADASAIVEQRINSTVAPQALFLLNNPFALKQAEALAHRAQASAKDDRSRIDWVYELLYSRPPTEKERSIGMNAVAGEPDGWTIYCQILLSANEFVYID